MEAMFSGSQALDARLNLVDWEGLVPREVAREMMGLGKAYNIFLKSGYETTLNQLWAGRRKNLLKPFGNMIVGALRHFGKLPDDLTPSEVA
eukprot:5867277-Alexandrium_andersonii.AAC.1